MSGEQELARRQSGGGRLARTGDERSPGRRTRTMSLPAAPAAARPEVSDPYARADASRLASLSLRAAASVAQRATIALGMDGLEEANGQELARRAADELIGHVAAAMSAATAGKGAVIDTGLAELAQYWGEQLRLSDHVEPDIDEALVPVLDELATLRAMHGAPHDGLRPANADAPIAALSGSDEDEVIRLSLATGRHRLAHLLNAPPAGEQAETRALLIAVAAAADDIAHATDRIRARSGSPKDSARWGDEAEELASVIQRIDQWVVRGRVPWDHGVAGLYVAEARLRDEVGAPRIERSQGPREEVEGVARELTRPEAEGGGGAGPTTGKAGLLGDIQSALALDFDRLHEVLASFEAMLAEVAPPAGKPWWEELISTAIQLAFLSMGSYAATTMGERLTARGWSRPGSDAARDALKNGLKSIYGGGQGKAGGGGEAAGGGRLISGVVLHDPKNIYLRGHGAALVDKKAAVAANFGTMRPYLEALDPGTLQGVSDAIDNESRRTALQAAYARQLTVDWVNLRAQLAHGDENNQVEPPQNQYGMPRGYGEGIVTVDIEVGPKRSALTRVTLNAEPRVVDNFRDNPALAGITIGQAPLHRAYRFHAHYALVEVPRAPGDGPFDLSGLTPVQHRTLVAMTDTFQHGVRVGSPLAAEAEASPLDAMVLAGVSDAALLSATLRRP